MTTLEENTRKLVDAAKQGRWDIVCRLIPVSNPTARGSRALRVAAWSGHRDVVRELLPVSDYAAAREGVLRWGVNENAVHLLDSVALERTLQREVTTQTIQPARRMRI